MRFLEGQALGASHLNSIAREIDRRREVSLNGAISGQDSPVTGLSLSSDSGQFWGRVLATAPSPSSGERGYLYVGEVIPDEKGTWVQTGGSYTAADGSLILNGKGREGRAYPVNWASQVPDGDIGLVFPGADGEWLFLTSSGGAASQPLVARTLLANDGTQWTAATLLTFSTVTGETVGPSPLETVDVKPVAGPLRSNTDYLCVDTGAKSPVLGDPSGGPYTGRRRFRTVTTTLTEVITEQVCDPASGATTNRDRMIPTI